jgi:hypothetical protein
MKRNIFIVGLLCSVIIYGGGRATAQRTVQTSDNRECMQNFTYVGSFWSGRIFKTHGVVQNVSKSVAVERAARYLAGAGGWYITTIDKESGVISASEQVGFGKGKTNPLNVSIEPVKNGVNVSISFSSSAHEIARGQMIQNIFCSIIEAIKK